METWRIVEKRTDVQVVAGRVTKAEVAEALGVPRRTINRYLARFGAEEPAGLRDRRHSNYRKAEAAMETVVVQAKKDGLHRGARFLRDYLEFVVSPETVRYILVKPHLERTSLPPIKPIGRFEAAEPNALWQDDIQGKVRFPLLGGLFLVLVKDDHSRLLLAGRWFFHHTRSTCSWCSTRRSDAEASRPTSSPIAARSSGRTSSTPRRSTEPGPGASGSSRSTTGGPGPRARSRTRSGSSSRTSCSGTRTPRLSRG
jgi:hypothetical protein